jgi:signal transduction histidine kinase
MAAFQFDSAVSRDATLPPVMSERFADARLFIVDDNPTNVALLQAILTRAGYRNLFSETDSRLVMSRLPEVDPDLVILDLHMPHLDGYALLEQLRQVASHDALPVLVLTADTTPAASQRALGSGAQDFVTKPFSNGEVLVRTRNLLRTRFAYTTLRSSLLREREFAREGQKLSQALSEEQEATEELRLLDGLKTTLLHTVSHDLRSPISAVLMMTTVLAADANGKRPLSAEVRSTIIEKVEQSALRMDRLLKDILDSDPMRSISGPQQVTDVTGVVERVLSEVDLRADHPIEVDIAPSAAFIDPAHLERIVENLLKNAQQHLAPGVPIWVKAMELGDEVLIVVEDAGTGVDAATAAGIFEPFRRGADAASGGLGLGLSLVSRFAQLHGGRAWVEDRAGGGASFRVALPSARTQTPAPVKPAAVTTAAKETSPVPGIEPENSALADELGWPVELVWALESASV